MEKMEADFLLCHRSFESLSVSKLNYVTKFETQKQFVKQAYQNSKGIIQCILKRSIVTLVEITDGLTVIKMPGEICLQNLAILLETDMYYILPQGYYMELSLLTISRKNRT